MFERITSPVYRAAPLILGITLARSSAAQSADPSESPAPQAAGPEASVQQTEPAPNSADRLFRLGREALQRGDYALACANLAESDRIEPSPGAKLNRALCEEPLGHLALAWRLLQASVAALQADDERALIAQRHAEDLRSKLAFATITLSPGSPKTARVVHDGAEFTSAELGAPFAFDPGAHVLEVTADGYMPQLTNFTLAAGDDRSLALSIGAPLVKQEGKRQSDPQPLPTTPWRTVGFGLGGAAAAMAVTCVVTGVLAHEAKQDMQRACDEHSACSEEGFQAAARGESYATISTASFVGALVTGGLGVALLLTSGRAPQQQAVSGRGLRWEF